MTRDVVVVGAGHNALVAACYLAREGLDVEVVERDTVVGGAVSTVERFPGYRVDRGASAHVLVRHSGIAEDLRLDTCGLVYQDLDPWAYAPFDDAALTFHVDVDATCESIAKVCGERDADAYARFVADWGARNAKVLEAFQNPPTPGRLGRSLWGLGSGTSGLELARQFLQPADALLDSWFDDERLKTALTWLGAQSGPPTDDVATADLVGFWTLCHRRAPGHPVGGSGALADALAARFRSYGGTLRLGDGASRIDTTDGRVTGVTTTTGERVAAPVVVSGCHVLSTLELLGDERLLDDARRRIRVGNGIGMVVRLATTDLPRYRAATEESYRAIQLLALSRRQIRDAYADFTTGRPARDPPVLAMTFSAFDETLAPAGRHNVTVWGQWHPYELADGERWDAIAEREGEKLVAAVDRAAPGFSSTVEQMHVQTPLDLERELGLRRGNVMHVEMTLDGMFAWRPVPEWSTYRGPRAGLYLTGASTHPGGGVFGASGRSAARVVLADRRRAWSPSRWRRAIACPG